MVGERPTRFAVLAALVALSGTLPACRGRGDSTGPAGAGRDCKPPSEEQLAEFVRLQSEGNELYMKKETAEAIARFEAAQKLHPCDVSICNDLGIAYHQQKKVNQAIEQLKRGTEIDPLYPLTWLNLGMIYDELANFDEAVRAFTTYLELRPDSAEAHRRLGTVYYKMSRYDDARSSMEKAVSLEPGHWEAWYTLGNLAFHNKDFARASELYAKTLELNPNYAEALYKQGTTLQRLGKEAEATAYLDKFKKLAPHQERIDDIQRLLQTETERKHELYVHLGMEVMRVGILPDARDAFTKALAVRPDFPRALAGLAEVARLEGKLDEAVATARRAKELAPDEVPAYDTLMASYAAQGKLDLAVAEVRELLARKPDYADYWLNLGNLEMQRGRWADAAPALEKFVGLKPDDVLGHEILLTVYLTATDPKVQNSAKALEQAAAAEKLGSTQFQLLAEAYHVNGDRNKAIELLNRGLQDPSHPRAEEMKQHLARIQRETR